MTETMTQSGLSAWDLFSQNETLSESLFRELVKTVRCGARERDQFRKSFKSIADGKSSVSAAEALKLAQGHYALGEFAQARDRLDQAGRGQTEELLRGQTLRALKDFDGAIAAFSAAQEKGRDNFAMTMQIVDCLRDAGRLEEAAEKLHSIAGGGEIRAEYHYQLGRLHDVNGRHEEAMNEYDEAIKLDANHTQALFYLAFACDLYGDETEAIEYYKRCVECGAPHVSALLNLAVLYEEAEKYSKALNCIRRVLNVYPNHHRARLFLKDIESSQTMLYDEEHEKRIDRHNQVMEIPISDFELSVRSRNCLKKMNIRTLGDLLNVTETELLAYKNFGETSLFEIKQVLTQKGLRLGQLLEDHNSTLRRSGLEDEEIEENNEALAVPITELDLSIRARKCLQRLNMQTLGDLVKCTEAELLGCKNFGQMSLEEIKQRLNDKGMALRTLDD